MASDPGQGLAGDMSLGFVIATNIGPGRCSIVGAPAAASVVTSSGRTVPVTLGPGQFPSGADTDLRAGDQARLAVQYEGTEDGACTTGTPQSLRLGLPAGGTVVVARPPFPLVSCPDLSVGTFYVLGADQPVPTPLDALGVSLHAPATVREGTVLPYTVTLTNPTPQPISLVPCPGYWAHGFLDGQSIVHDQLNCNGMTSIGSGRSVTFAMRIAVPDTPDPGAPLYWHLDTPAYQDGGSTPGLHEATTGVIVTAETAPTPK